MAQLSSPGVSVTVVDESFYTPAAPGTVPLIVVASQENKLNAAGTGTAVGTLKANAGKVYLMTSQMDLGNTFGIPYFQTDASNNPVHAGELNEYGLQAAYSFLGVSNRAYVVRADLDTSQLVGDAIEPTGAPADGTYWFDVNNTSFGIFEWNAAAATAGGQTFTVKHVTVVTDVAQTTGASTYAPIPSLGQVGDYALVAVTSLNKLWYKKPATDTAAGTWVAVGSPEWKASWPTVAGTNLNNANTISGTGTTFTGHMFDDGAKALSVISAVVNGPLQIGDIVSGSNLASNTRIVDKLTATFTGSTNGTALTTSGASGDDIEVGMVISGAGVTGFPYIVSGSGTTWVLSASQGTLTDVAMTGEVYRTDDEPIGEVTGTITTGGDVLVINGTLISGTVGGGALVTAINDAFGPGTGITAANINGKLMIYSTGAEIDLSGTATGTADALGIEIGTYAAPALSIAPHYNVPLYKVTDTSYVNGLPTGSLWVKTTSVNQGADWIIKKYNASTSSWLEQPVKLAGSNAEALSVLDPKGGGINISIGSVFVKYNDDEGADPYATFKIYGRVGVGQTTVVSKAIGTTTLPTNNYSFTLGWSVPGTSAISTAVVSFNGTGATADALELVTKINAAVNGDPNVVAKINSDNSFTLYHTAGGELRFTDGANTPVAKLYTVGTTTNFFADPSGTSGKYVGSLWSAMSGGSAFAPASTTAPTTIPADGTLWFNSVVDEVDIMINDGQGAWRGLTNGGIPALGGGATGRYVPIVSATQPTAQPDGTALANGDLWVDTTDFDNYPHIYKYNYATKKWVLVDNSDQTTENGILFHDARWNDESGVSQESPGTGTPASVQSLLASDYVDFDAPDPALYPKGMLLWNLRRSGNNVLKFVRNYVDVTERNARSETNQPQTYYYPHRWVSQAPNQLNGAGTFGRKAQRAVVLTALNELINSNQQIRDEDSRQFNLLACPGYLETLSTLIDLNTSRGETAFIVADTPARLTPDATSLSNWGQNVAGAAVDGEDGLIATNSYAAVYYPWGYTTDLLGNNIVVPPSHIMLRTIALSDNVSYPWFAPAGVRRGGVTNASSVGYVDPITGEFNTVALNNGQRDTLAGVHVNPITYIAGTGLVAYGQKTRQLVASSLDRINVARLVIYLRYQLNQIAKPYVFEPNDTITRNEIKNQIEAMLLELTGQRALYDYIVVCDTSNNTPARIDANELHVDIAIEPVKAVEFIYIPMRLENTGAIKALG